MFRFSFILAHSTCLRAGGGNVREFAQIEIVLNVLAGLSRSSGAAGVGLEDEIGSRVFALVASVATHATV